MKTISDGDLEGMERNEINSVTLSDFIHRQPIPSESY